MCLLECYYSFIHITRTSGLTKLLFMEHLILEGFLFKMNIEMTEYFEIYYFHLLQHNGQQGWRSVAHQCGQGSISAPCHVGVEFVIDSRLAPSVFLPPHTKPNISNSYSARLDQADVFSSINIVNNYYFYYEFCACSLYRSHYP